MKVYTTDRFVLPLPAGHRFPMSKYTRLRERVTEADWAGTVDLREIRRIGFPWTPGMVERSRRSTGATIAAARDALVEGVAVSLAGGTHHAFAGQGEGFCVFNDSVVAARVLRDEGRIRRAVVIDCDVHLPLPDGTEDTTYLAALEPALEQALETANADLAFYLSGADPWKGDRWGRLGLTKEGLATRDAIVLEACTRQNLPVAITMAGGYAPQVEDTVDIHLQTVRAATNAHKARPPR